MFDKSGVVDADTALAGLTGVLTALDQGASDAVRIDRIRLLEELKSAVAAAQIRESAAFAVSQRAVQTAAGVPAAKAGRGVAAQIALARRLSPYRARQQLGWATILITELPHTFAALQAGVCTEWRAMIVARETGWLSREHRTIVDAELAPRLGQWGDRRVEKETQKIAYRLDPRGYVNRLATAASERRVSIRPAPDTMCRVTALLPVTQGVAAFAALSKYADTLISHGDTRSRGQIMADTFYERLTGQAHADDVPIEVDLIITDQALFGDALFTDAFFTEANRADNPPANPPANPSDEGAGEGAGDDPAADADRRAAGTGATGGSGHPAAPTHTPGNGSNPGSGSAGVHEPAYLLGYGWIPAAVARDLILGAADTAPRWIRRLYTRPDTGHLIAMDSRRRCFTPAQRRFIQLRDHTCRTPFCDAPIRHTDHVTSHARGGPTSVDNGQGACAACNHWKEAPGWTMTTSDSGAGEQVDITTPTGHHYTSHPPDPPGAPTPTPSSVHTAPDVDTGQEANAGRESPLPHRAEQPDAADQARPKAA